MHIPWSDEVRHRVPVSPVNRRAEATAPNVAAPPGRPRNTDSGDTRQRVLDAAIDVFAEHGFDGASSKAIAIAGVTPATIYHHFGNKRGLYRGLPTFGSTLPGRRLGRRRARRLVGVGGHGGRP